MNEMKSITTQRKVFTPKHIFLATFFGGPLATGYMLANNYKALGQNEYVKHCWIATALFYTLLITVLLLIPEDTKMPNFIIPLLYSWGARWLAEKLQGNLLEEYLTEGGLLYRWKRILVVTLLSFLATLVFIVVFVGVLVSFDLIEY